jgi:hypothetical protein
MGDNGKHRFLKKINIIDILIALIIITAIAGAIYKFTRPDTANFFVEKTEKITIEFYHEEVPEFAVKAVQKGDICIEPVQSANFGKVTDIEINKSVSWADTEEGEFVIASKPGYSSVRITMEADGVVGSNGVTIGKTVYYVGQTVSLNVGNSMFSNGRISGVSKKG